MVAEPRSLLGRALSSRFLRFPVLAAQLALLLYLVAIWYGLEGGAFRKLAVMLFAGFSVHYFLPARARLPFFALLSLGGVLVIFGPRAGGWLVAVGLALIGLCHLPVPFLWRCLVVAAAILALALARASLLPVPWSSAIWPILGSMFMMRVIVYLYDLGHGKAPAGFWRAVGYFFMLPNVCFPLFPVVDYETFCRTDHNDKEDSRIYQSGISWMVRGVVHLLLYRLVYQHLPIDTTAVTDLTQLVRYLSWPFLLYLHVSGLFHLTVGMLHLFGFNLPETHHLFYLAPSFTDFWRRINIYWKDFMLKVFYYPAFFKLRKVGQTRALVIGTFWVFFATWVLHSWQWFWLRGQPLLKWNDALFWAILAVLVAVNVVYENTRPMRRKLGKTKAPMRESIVLAVRALGVFVSICILWSLWISESVGGWLSLFALPRGGLASGASIVPFVLAFGVVFVLVATWYERRTPRPFTFWGSAVRCTATIVCLFIAGAPSVYGTLGPELANHVKNLKSPGLNSRAMAHRQRDYYEKLNDVGWDDPELAKVFMERPADWGPIRYRTDLAKLDTGLPYLELLPNVSGRHRGALMHFNRWGFRDDDCEQTPPEGTFRIALLGSSHTFGAGVAAEESFGSLVEARLNTEDQLTPFKKVEILNFAVEGYSPLDVVAQLDKKVLAFEPHAIVYVVNPGDEARAAGRAAELYAEGTDSGYPETAAFAAAAGVKPHMEKERANRLIQQSSRDVLLWSLQQMVARCKDRSITPVLVFLAVLAPRDGSLPAPEVLAVGREAGFLTIDLSGVYDGYDIDDLQLAPWDNHPNVQGHHLVADQLYPGLRNIETSLWRAHGQAVDQGSGENVSPAGVLAGRGP